MQALNPAHLKHYWEKMKVLRQYHCSCAAGFFLDSSSTQAAQSTQTSLTYSYNCLRRNCAQNLTKHGYTDRLIRSRNDRLVCGHVWARFGGSQEHLPINWNPSTLCLLCFFFYHPYLVLPPWIIASKPSATRNPPQPRQLIALARLSEGATHRHGSLKKLH